MNRQIAVLSRALLCLCFPWREETRYHEELISGPGCIREWGGPEHIPGQRLGREVVGCGCEARRWLTTQTFLESCSLVTRAGLLGEMSDLSIAACCKWSAETYVPMGTILGSTGIYKRQFRTMSDWTSHLLPRISCTTVSRPRGQRKMSHSTTLLGGWMSRVIQSFDCLFRKFRFALFLVYSLKIGLSSFC